jgi:23S rRNA maturation-related 3'-5' exoribonuclease YhaM
MKEVILFAVVLFAVLEVSATQSPVKEVVRVKPVYIEKKVVVVQPRIIQKTRRIIVIHRPAYRERTSCHQIRIYQATYEFPVGEKPAPVRVESPPREEKEVKQTENIDSYCRFKSPNFFGAESKCKEWRRTHGYDY